MNGPRRLPALVALTLAAALPASAVAAETYCVDRPTCPAGGQDRATVGAALGSAEADVDEDTILIGPGVFEETGLTNVNPVTIRGAGIASTVLRAPVGTVLELRNPASEVSDLRIRLTEVSQTGLRLDDSFGQRIGVDSPPALVASRGVVVDGATLADSVVTLPNHPSLTGPAAVSVEDGGTVLTSTLTGDTALRMDEGGLVRRVRLLGQYGVVIGEGTQDLAQLIARPHPDLGAAETFTAVWAVSQNGIDPARAEIAHMTALGRGNAQDVALFAQASSGTEAGIEASNVLLRGFGVNLRRQSAGADADVDTAYSSFDETKQAAVGSGSFNTTPGHVPGEADPRFVAPFAGDYRLRYDSPLLDQGDPTPVTLAEALFGDFAGRPRGRDSDGNGSVRRDIGAFEYQRLPPVAAFSTSSPAQFGDPVQFDAGPSTDPDGDPLTYSWAFGDGAAANGEDVTHRYALPGTRTATLTALDPIGLSDGASREVVVELRTGPCANRRSGGSGNDTIDGFQVGDLIFGRRGDDTLIGNRGADCLNGGRGRDTLRGGRGRDTLRGGPGKNTLGGGRGNDRLFAVNGRKDAVSCGAGRKDEARVDPADAVSGCEQVDRE